MGCPQVIVLALFLSASSAPATPVVGRMLDLFARLQTAQQLKARGKPAQPVTFQFSDSELNQYLAYSLRAVPRPGLQSATVKIFPYNYITTFTVVDFDAVEKWKPGTVPVLLRPVLNGRKAIWVDFRFQVRNGMATFSVEKAYFQGIRLPAFFVEKMIAIVAARQPEHYDTTKPLPLPFGLRQISTQNHVVMGGT